MTFTPYAFESTTIVVLSRMKLGLAVFSTSVVALGGTLSLAFVFGTETSYPVNRWLVQAGLKHGMGGSPRSGLRDSVFAGSKLAMTLAFGPSSHGKESFQ